MKIFRTFLPLYKRTINNLSRGKGYGKNKSVRKIMHFFDLLFRSNEVMVHGHMMQLPSKGFLPYSTDGIYGKLDTLMIERLVQPGDYTIDVGADYWIFYISSCSISKK